MWPVNLQLPWTWNNRVFHSAQCLKSITKLANLWGCCLITDQKWADLHSGIIKVPFALHFIKWWMTEMITDTGGYTHTVVFNWPILRKCIHSFTHWWSESRIKHHRIYLSVIFIEKFTGKIRTFVFRPWDPLKALRDIIVQSQHKNINGYLIKNELRATIINDSTSFLIVRK